MLGIGSTKDEYRAQASLVLNSIVDMSCGSDHSACVGNNGNVFTFGMGLYGALGHGDIVSHPQPTRIEVLQGVSFAKVFCGVRVSFGGI